MTKAEIVNEVAKATGIEKTTVAAVVESFMESVKGSLAKGNPVYLRGFGSFIIKHRAEKAARNITKKDSTTAATVVFSMPVVLATSFTISALVITIFFFNSLTIIDIGSQR